MLTRFLATKWLANSLKLLVRSKIAVSTVIQRWLQHCILIHKL